MNPTSESIDVLGAQNAVLYTALMALYATAKNKEQLHALFERLSERSIDELLPHGISDGAIELAKEWRSGLLEAIGAES